LADRKQLEAHLWERALPVISESPGRPWRCAYSRIKLDGDPADCFFVRKGRKERKESKDGFRLKRPHSATVLLLLSFASFASLADKALYQ
jgi:hypothetical protein